MPTIRAPRSAVPMLSVAAAGIAFLVAGCASPTTSTDAEARPNVTATATTAPTTAPTPTIEAYDCNGATINHSAAITSAHDLLIDASIDRIWDVQADVEGWTAWQPAVTSIERLDAGALAVGSQFRWTTPVPESQLSPSDTLTITSSVLQLEPGDCILWEGPAIGAAIQIEQGIHLWTFTEVDGGTLVHTEESWDADILNALVGPDADAAEQMLGGGLAIWLDNLKTAAEAV